MLRIKRLYKRIGVVIGLFIFVFGFHVISDQNDLVIREVVKIYFPDFISYPETETKKLYEAI